MWNVPAASAAGTNAGAGLMTALDGNAESWDPRFCSGVQRWRLQGNLGGHWTPVRNLGAHDSAVASNVAKLWQGGSRDE